MIAKTPPHLEKIFADLFLAWEDDGRQLVSIPISYPSGSLATMELSMGKSHVHVTDMGIGMHEAEVLTEDTSYKRFAMVEAFRNGLRFDGRAIVALDVPMEQAAAAISAVANASVAAARAAIRSDGDKREAANLNEIYDKVRMAFPSAHVHKVIEIAGGKTSWTAHNVVDLRDNRMAIFEPVTRHANSISSKFLMFSDLREREDVSLNAVFDSINNLDPKALMLRDVANIISADDSIEAFRRKA